MDKDLKRQIRAWELTELEHEAATPAGGIGNAIGWPECSVDLKLGGLCEIGAAANNRDVGKVSEATLSSSSSGAVKLPQHTTSGGGRGSPRGAAQKMYPSCAVDGCMVDLSTCRDYYRKHKVCEAHSKTPIVTVAGREMRFCQQCSRFHLLTEFDEAKRSCRKRLDGHNRRRRKPRPDNMNFECFMTSQQGNMFSSFATPRPMENWPGIIETEENLYYMHQNLLGISNMEHFVGSTSTNAKEGPHFGFLQEGEKIFATQPLGQPLLKIVAPPERMSSSNMTFPDGLTPVLDSDSALSPLSDLANSSGVDVGKMVQQTEHIPSTQHLFSSSSSFLCSQASIGSVSATGFSGPAVGNEQLNNNDLSPDNNETNYNGIFQVEGSSGGSPSSLCFPWQ
uniref:Uncharacterized protein n=1 Tax=Avena sativa TaxID=4498 RepID=A0ACD5UW85_AVESA